MWCSNIRWREEKGGRELKLSEKVINGETEA